MKMSKDQFFKFGILFLLLGLVLNLGGCATKPKPPFEISSPEKAMIYGNIHIPGQTMLVFEPGFVMSFLTAWWPGRVINTTTLFITKPQTRQYIGDQTQSFPTASVFTPELGFVAIHILKKLLSLIGLNHG